MRAFSLNHLVRELQDYLQRKMRLPDPPVLQVKEQTLDSTKKLGSYSITSETLIDVFPAHLPFKFESSWPTDPDATFVKWREYFVTYYDAIPNTVGLEFKGNNVKEGAPLSQYVFKGYQLNPKAFFSIHFNISLPLSFSYDFNHSSHQFTIRQQDQPVSTLTAEISRRFGILPKQLAVMFSHNEVPDNCPLKFVRRDKLEICLIFHVFVQDDEGTSKIYSQYREIGQIGRNLGFPYVVIGREEIPPETTMVEVAKQNVNKLYIKRATIVSVKCNSDTQNLVCLASGTVADLRTKIRLVFNIGDSPFELWDGSDVLSDTRPIKGLKSLRLKLLDDRRSAKTINRSGTTPVGLSKRDSDSSDARLEFREIFIIFKTSKSEYKENLPAIAKPGDARRKLEYNSLEFYSDERMIGEDEYLITAGKCVRARKVSGGQNFGVRKPESVTISRTSTVAKVRKDLAKRLGCEPANVQIYDKRQQIVNSGDISDVFSRRGTVCCDLCYPLTLNVEGGDAFVIEFAVGGTAADLKRELSRYLQCSPREIGLHSRGRPLRSIDVPKISEVDVVRNKVGLRVKFRGKEGRDLPLNFGNLDATIADAKERLARKIEGVHRTDLVLSFAGTRLDDSSRLGDLCVTPASVIWFRVEETNT
jgi:hypothetical protein